MKRFNFPLERVLEYRTYLQKNEKIILADLQAQHQRLCAQRDALAMQLAACGREYEALCAKGAAVKTLRSYTIYMAELRSQLERQNKAVSQSQERIDRQTEKVVAANRDKRGLDILKEKQTGFYLSAARREEERRVEEFVSIAGLSAAR